MRIGIDGTALYGRYGGVEYALWNLLVALQASEGSAPAGPSALEYVVYVPHDGPPPANLDRFGLRWRWVRLPFKGADKGRRVWWQQSVLPRQLLRDGCHLLHSPTYVSPLLCPVPVVLTVYDFIALTHPRFATPMNRVHYGAMLPRCVKGAHRIIVPSDAVRRELARRVPAAAARAHVVPLGVEPLFRERFDDATKAQVRARYRLPGRFVLFVGNPEPKKNLRGVLRALDLLPQNPTCDVPLVVVGGARAWTGYELGTTYTMPQSPSDNAMFDDAMPHGTMPDGTMHHAAMDNAKVSGAGVGASALTSPSLASRTVSLGYVPRRDLAVVYALCEAFVFPSLAEGFGLPVLEALSAGAPVVASDRVPLPELQQAAMICNPHDDSSIASQLELVLSNRALRLELQERARSFAAPYTWRRTAEMTVDVYRSLAR
jgi:glycosyltransferase involved in cell wall biosynthesis